MKTIIKIDLTLCKTLSDIHKTSKIAFDFPEWYGENWDAFWDLLNEPRENTFVEVYGINTLPKSLKKSGEMLIEILEENKTDYDEFIKKYNMPRLKFDYIVRN